MEITSTSNNIFHSFSFVWELSGQLSNTNCEFYQFSAKLRNEWHFTTMSTSAFMTWYLGAGAIYILLYDFFSNTCLVTNVYCWRCRMSACREALFESYVNMLHQHCDEAPGTYCVLQGVLQRSIKESPDNIYLLTTAAKLQVSTVLFLTQKNLFSITYIVDGHSYHHHLLLQVIISCVHHPRNLYLTIHHHLHPIMA